MSDKQNLQTQFVKQHEIGSGMPKTVSLPVHKSRHIPSINHVLERSQYDSFQRTARSNDDGKGSQIPEKTINKRGKSEVPFPAAIAVSPTW
jgi:hypothetical protein